MIRPFLRDLLIRHGAVVDDRDEGAVDVVASSALAASIGLGEDDRLVFSPEAGAGRRIDHDSTVLDRLAPLVESLGRVALARLASTPAPRGIDAGEQLERAVTLQNGVVRAAATAVSEDLYLGATFEYELLADEREGGLVRVWANTATRSVAEAADWPVATDTAAGADAPDRWPIDGPVTLPWALAAAAGRARLAGAAADFVERLARRRDRDARRLKEYASDIDGAIRRKLARAAPGGPAAARERDRLEATWRSYRSRLGDLRERYRARVRLLPRAAVLVPVPVHHVTAELKRRMAVRHMTFAWNPLDGRIEARACDACERPTRRAWLCDEQVHYLCDACFARCAACDRPFCRACHAECPRGHRQESGGA